MRKKRFKKAYKEHLAQLGLLQREYNIDPGTRIPQLDISTGSLETRRYKISSLGRLLLKYIGFADDFSRV